MTHMASPPYEVGVRELRQNLSKYLARVKAGEALIVTERGKEVARLTPSLEREDLRARLVRKYGARPGMGDHRHGPPPIEWDGPPSSEILEEMSADTV